LVKNGFSGMLIPEGDTGVFAESILDLTGSREKCEYIGSNAYNEVVSNFSRENWVRVMRDTFNEILKDRVSIDDNRFSEAGINK